MKNYADHYKNRDESLRLVGIINQYWTRRGYPHFSAYVEEQIHELPNDRKERIFIIRSNIKQRSQP